LQSLWNFFEIEPCTPHRCVLEKPVMTGAVWFPGAQVNYARLALRHADAAQGAAPTDRELHALLQAVITRFMKMLTRLGVLDEELGQTSLVELDADGDEARTLRPLQAVAVTYRIAFGPRAGRKLLTLMSAMPRETAARQPLCADIDGFSLHAAVRVEAHDRKRLEQLRRYITRPALSHDQVQINAAGLVEPKLKTPRRDGTTHLVMSRWSSCGGWQR